MPFYEIEFPLSPLSQDTLDDVLEELGALSITYVDGTDDEPVLEPKPGEVRLWRDTRVRALFDQSTEPLLNLKKLSVALGTTVTNHARVRAVADQAWERVWLEGWKPMRFGRRLWVYPTTAEAPADPEAVIVRLDPGLAFGTGSHATTALCLAVLDSLELAGSTVIDYGCGSGLLGIAALKLGAEQVFAVDIDPQALIATRDNAARNGLAAQIVVLDAAAVSTETLMPPADFVLANILAGPLIELAPRLTAACKHGGHLILSGLLRGQSEAVSAAYASGFDMLEVLTEDDWCCIHARRGT
jgi:ribosomal protein L11 methyltransferase